ncbi:hypothetical protein MTR67_002501 [Solanum verrucosum]|uniref:Uncharacterized protein n=1 Tax=Solanum verrucosum TaxID=315347 RepID=A0AAF0PUV7_SOLVR|nr:hypothetical protein MTR67_002501 [Solanum verrucosum]
MRNPIEELEARTEKIVEVKIQVLHQRIDAFELRMPERPHPRLIVDVASFQSELAKLWADIDALTTLESKYYNPTSVIFSTTWTYSSYKFLRSISVDLGALESAFGSIWGAPSGVPSEFEAPTNSC